MEATIPKLLQRIAQEYPDHHGQLSKDRDGVFQPTSFKKLLEEVQSVAAGLLSIGVKRGDHVGLIADNCKEWLLADLGILSVGAADVPRGNDATDKEVSYILGFAECATVIVENVSGLQRVSRLRSDLKRVKQIVVLDPDYESGDKPSDLRGVTVHRLSDIMKTGSEKLEKQPDLVEREIAAGAENDVATLIFTSGTTGEPKGVMLSHKNFLHQVEHVPELIRVGPGDIWLCVLPVWHSFERIMQYVALGSASALAYSKPIGKIMLADFAAIRPTWMASVPRIWESLQAGIYRNINNQGGIKSVLFHFFVGVGKVHTRFSNMVKGLLPRFHKRIRGLDFALGILPYVLLWPLRALGNVLVFSKIKARLGGRFVAGISGGGALPGYVDNFFAAAGVLLLEGYGLTETAPVLGVRDQSHPVPGTVGPVFPGTEVKIVDETGKPLPPGTRGVVMARGPQVMLGYYNRPEETARMIDAEGWLNTGDLGKLTWDNELTIVGRAKDTIVLLGGENVEPAPIESKLRESSYIDQVVVLGQDKKFLACLIVPNTEQLEQFARENSLPYLDVPQLITAPEVHELFSSEISSLVSPQNGFKSFERIYRFKLLDTEFMAGRELSGKQEVKRHAVNEIYAREIADLFKT